MSAEALALPPSFYRPPEGSTDMGERKIESSNLGVILYIGDIATADIVVLDDRDKPEVLLRRVEDTRDRAMDLLYHTQSYLPAEDARAIFDPPKAA